MIRLFLGICFRKHSIVAQTCSDATISETRLLRNTQCLEGSSAISSQWISGFKYCLEKNLPSSADLLPITRLKTIDILDDLEAVLKKADTGLKKALRLNFHQDDLADIFKKVLLVSVRPCLCLKDCLHSSLRNQRQNITSSSLPSVSLLQQDLWLISGCHVLISC